MDQFNLLCKNFLFNLERNRTISHNPFLKNQIKENTYESFTFSPFGFYEDLCEKEVRCPICLGRVSVASKPDKCWHTFCNYCLEKWHKKSDKCPICRQIFHKIELTDITNEEISEQLDIFCL
jgi:hypothetical protein